MTALLLAACGGGQQAAPSARDARAAAPAGPPPLPADPIALVPAGPREIVSAQLAQVRASQHYPTLQQWFQHYGCMTADPSHFLFGRTDRALLASFGANAGEQGAERLLVLRGRYQPEDADRALAEAQRLLGGEEGGAVAQATQGRFQVHTQGQLAAAVLNEELLVIGDSGRVAAALAVADGKQPSVLKQGALFPGLDAGWLAGHTLAAITQLDERSAERIGKQLSGIGGRKLGQGLTQSSAALSLGLSAGLELNAHVQYAAADAANEAAVGLRAVIGRAGLVLRLTGLPPALERTTVTTDGQRMNVSLSVTEDELRAILERIEPMLRSDAPPCGTQAAIAAPDDATHVAGVN
jgi:hypothetical protein